jgi:hypothetical protein
MHNALILLPTGENAACTVSRVTQNFGLVLR